MASPLPNRIGKYRVIAKLGQGGMAQVLLTMVDGPAGFSKLMVVKQLREELASDPEFLTMFMDEARLAALLNHRNVVHTYEVVSEGETHFIVMEYLEGQPLNRILSRVGRDIVPLEIHLRILSQTLAGLHYAHELRDFDGTPLDVIHRDVSPQNVFVSYDGQVKLVDFGIAKASGAANLTKAGVFKGKVGYMAPEQAGSEKVDRRADIFALGVMMWEALARKRMTKGKQDLVVLNARIQGTEPRVSTMDLDVPPELIDICDKAMAHNRTDRFETAEAFRDELDSFLDHSGLRVDDRAIGQFVSDYFAKQRERLREKVENQVKMHAEARPSRAGSVPVITIDEPAASWRDSIPDTGTGRMPPVTIEGGGFGDGATIPDASIPDARESGAGTLQATMPAIVASRLGEADDETVSTTGTAKHFTTETSLTSEGRSRLTLFAVAGALGVGALLFFAFGRGETEPANGAASTASTATNTAAAPTASVLVTDGLAPKDLMAFSVKVTPKAAKVKLDGASLGRNPFSANVKRDGSMHRIEVELEGYEKIDQMVTFDGDLALELSLEPAKKKNDDDDGGKTKTVTRIVHVPAPPTPTAVVATPKPTAPTMGEDLRRPPPSTGSGKTPRGIDESDPYKQNK